MIICPKCYFANADKDARCTKCGASIAGIPDQENKDRIVEWRDRTRRKNHMITGAILCFGLPTVFGLPSSLAPTNLLANVIFGLAFGVPLGYLVSRYATTMIGGALIGCLIGIAYCTAIMLFMGGHVTLIAVLIGISTGAVPGGIMGYHVENDN
jgi:hypothetical protein